ncbi:protein of unknown function [Hyphomicrobium sp. 1Nfss2.1]|uniref:hypothetical protein n=1 Tax=Hyphomicrobium sp. 1Nfss2.1 TaxID=3413936 RepID=UPI003C7DAA5C
MRDNERAVRVIKSMMASHTKAARVRQRTTAKYKIDELKAERTQLRAQIDAINKKIERYQVLLT